MYELSCKPSLLIFQIIDILNIARLLIIDNETDLQAVIIPVSDDDRVLPFEQKVTLRHNRIAVIVLYIIGFCSIVTENEIALVPIRVQFIGNRRNRRNGLL